MKAHQRWRAGYMKQQALWFKSCSESHKIFCNCGDWMSHISKPRCLTDTGADVSLQEGISFISEKGDGPGGDVAGIIEKEEAAR
ncbi:ORF2 [Grizzly bear anellovirus 5]|nr:ORF2 [Grizzly bear anellovirus 5]